MKCLKKICDMEIPMILCFPNILIIRYLNVVVLKIYRMYVVWYSKYGYRIWAFYILKLHLLKEIKFQHDFEFQEIESNEKLRMEIRNLELQKEQLNSQLQESKSMSGLDRDRPGSSTAMDSKGWKSAVVTRMYEGKLKDLEKELEKKVRYIKKCFVLNVKNVLFHAVKTSST